MRRKKSNPIPKASNKPMAKLPNGSGRTSRRANAITSIGMSKRYKLAIFGEDLVNDDTKATTRVKAIPPNAPPQMASEGLTLGIKAADAHPKAARALSATDSPKTRAARADAERSPEGPDSCNPSGLLSEVRIDRLALAKGAMESKGSMLTKSIERPAGNTQAKSSAPRATSETIKATVRISPERRVDIYSLQST